MRKRFVWIQQYVLLFTVVVASPVVTTAFADESVEASIRAVRSVGKEGAGYESAIPAARRLRSLPADRVTLLLDGLADTNPIAENWIRGVVFDVMRSTDESLLALLGDYAMDRSNNPIGRGLAMELIRKKSPETASKLIAACLDDPSLPLREMAVQQAMDRAERLADENADDAKQLYRKTLVAARHPRQMSRIVESLGDLGDDVKTADAFSMITRWQSLAPFDNVDGVGFDAVYAPESEVASSRTVDLNAAHEGKDGEIRWRELDASEDEGTLDLAAAYDKEKGAVSYLYTEFDSSSSRPAQARLGCINAIKVWINGKLVMVNEVYHSGSMIDQYIADFQLQEGTNQILLKICQNEQTESWAQDWEFQFRITDPTGKGLRSGE